MNIIKKERLGIDKKEKPVGEKEKQRKIKDGKIKMIKRHKERTGSAKTRRQKQTEWNENGRSYQKKAYVKGEEYKMSKDK